MPLTDLLQTKPKTLADLPAPPMAAMTPMNAIPAGAISAPAPLDVAPDPRMGSSALDPLVQRQGDLNADLYNRTHPVAPTTALGKIGHVAANVGNVLGNIFAPDAMALIPGTQLYNERIEARDKQDLADNAGLQQQQAQTALTKAQPGILQAKLQQKQDIADAANQQKAAQHGQTYTRDEDGNVQIADDPNSEVFQRNQIKENLLDAQVKSTGAQEELRQAQTAYDQAKVDPTSPLFRQVAQRLAIAQQNANAAVTRAQAYMGNYLQHTKNVDLAGNTLAGAPVITDSQGAQSVVGSTNAGAAIKQNSAVGSFNDLSGSVDHTENAVKSMFAKGGHLTDPDVISALADHHTPMAQWIGGLVQTGLSPEKIAAVTAIRQNQEQAGILRKTTGGTASEAGSQRILDTVPSPGDTDEMALSKIAEQKNVRDRLAPGMTAVSGGLDVAGKAPTASVIRQPARNTPTASNDPKEGTTKTNSAGDKIVFKGGKWGPA